MLGRASWMRLPDIVGVELTGRRQPGITATDIVLTLTEFLRKERVVGAYLEFFGAGASSLTLGDRATISNRSEEHTSELQSLMRISYAVFCLKKKNTKHRNITKKL